MADFAIAAAKTGGTESPAILELPCGYGRVTRHLVKHFDAAKIHVADIMVPCVDYCINEFDVAGHYVDKPVYKFRNIPDDRYDVAVMGSLITHLSMP